LTVGTIVAMSDDGLHNLRNKVHVEVVVNVPKKEVATSTVDRREEEAGIVEEVVYAPGFEDSLVTKVRENPVESVRVVSETEGEEDGVGVAPGEGRLGDAISQADRDTRDAWEETGGHLAPRQAAITYAGSVPTRASGAGRRVEKDVEESEWVVIGYALDWYSRLADSGKFDFSLHALPKTNERLAASSRSRGHRPMVIEVGGYSSTLDLGHRRNSRGIRRSRLGGRLKTVFQFQLSRWK
jgi:hypothetical protein